MLVLFFPTIVSFSVVAMALHILSDPYLICCVNKDLCLIVVEKELRMANLLYEISTYVGTVYTKYPADFTAAVDSLDLADPDEHPAPDPANQVAFERWKYVYKEYMNKLQEYTNFRSGLYNLVKSQCTEALKECLKSHEDFMDANQNGIALLTLIRSLLLTFEERRKLADGLSDMKMAFYKLRQGKYMKLERYHEIFLAQVEVLDEVGVSIPDTALIQQVAEQHGRGVPRAAD